MNDIVKQNIKGRLEAAMLKEKLTNLSAAFKLGVNPQYISVIKNPKQWHKCGTPMWEIVLKWVNSGQGIQEYFDKHGKFVPEKEESVPEVKETVTKVVEDVSETKPIVQETVIPDKPRIKVNPVTHAKRQEQLEHKRMSKGEMIDVLLEEKALCKQKIEAIDVLLKHYIS